MIYFYNSCIESIDVGLYNENSSFSTQTKKNKTMPMPTLLETML